MTAVEWIVKQYEQKIGKSISSVMADEIKQAKEMDKEQHQETWETAHQAGRFEGKGIAEENWQTFETYWEETFKTE